jgi:(2Fe-2S) ferredoxin
MSVIATPNNDLNNLAGDGIIETMGGEMIKYKNGKLYAAGNVDSNNVVSIVDTKMLKNGTVYYTDRLLYWSALTIGKRLEALAASSTSPYYNFVQYLKGSKLYNATTGTIAGVPLGFFGSILIPDNNAILAAVTAGLLPASTTPTATIDQELVTSFIQSHILKKSVVADGKLHNDDVETIFKNLNDHTGVVTVDNRGGNIIFKDEFSRVANIDQANSYVLADRIVIHSINTYLLPKK